MDEPQYLHQITVLEYQRTPYSYRATLASLDGLRSCAEGGPWIFVQDTMRLRAMEFLSTRGIHCDRNGQLSAALCLEDMSSRHVICDGSHLATVTAALETRVGGGLQGGRGRENVRIRNVAKFYIALTGMSMGRSSEPAQQCPIRVQA